MGQLTRISQKYERLTPSERRKTFAAVDYRECSARLARYCALHRFQTELPDAGISSGRHDGVTRASRRYPSATRVRTNDNIEDAVFEKDPAAVLREEGYTTALIGKNHSHLREEDVDHWVEFGHGGEKTGEKTTEETDFDAYLTGLRHRTDLSPTPFPAELQNPYRIVTKATGWIESVGNRPFFLWMSIPEPHNPFQVSEPYYSAYPPESLPKLASTREHANTKGYKYQFMRQQWEVLERTRSNYLGMLSLIDDQLGRFLDLLGSSGRREDTIIVFTSDHGDFWGEYGLIRKGPELPEVLSRIPLVVTGPDVDAFAERLDAHVSLADIMPTLCDAIGAPIPRGVQGRSFRPLLSDGSDAGSSNAAATRAAATHSRDTRAAAQGVSSRSSRHRFADAYVEHGFGGAYYTDADDLELDPVELDNCFADPALRNVREELLQELLGWTLRCEDPLPNPRRRYYF